MARFTVHLLPPGRRLDRGAPRLVAAVVTFIVGLFGALPTAHAAGIALQDSAGTNLTSPGTYGWVGSWMTAADRAGKAKPAATGFADKTLRQVVDLSLGGDRIRVRLTNVFGERRLRIGLASVALRSERAGAATQGQPLALTFGGKRAVDIPVGAEVVSDPVTLPVPDGARLLISLYLPTPTGPATVHHRGWATTFQARGNAALDPRGTRFTPIGTSSYFLSGVDVLTRSTGAVVAFGDSITEGCCEPSFVDADRSYPDLLAAAAVDARRLGVLNAGISGNALLSDGSGVSGLGRFERDVLR
ncbi:MAG TPA: hypothetical protein VK020_08995, partial [Microlunatus sp.]|nr:hypothetical protein [Microlunatus sp.]